MRCASRTSLESPATGPAARNQLPSLCNALIPLSILSPERNRPARRDGWDAAPGTSRRASRAPQASPTAQPQPASQQLSRCTLVKHSEALRAARSASAANHNILCPSPARTQMCAADASPLRSMCTTRNGSDASKLPDGSAGGTPDGPYDFRWRESVPRAHPRNRRALVLLPRPRFRKVIPPRGTAPRPCPLRSRPVS